VKILRQLLKTYWYITFGLPLHQSVGKVLDKDKVVTWVSEHSMQNNNPVAFMSKYWQYDTLATSLYWLI